MKQLENETAAVEALASVKGAKWERHGYRRIYVDVELTCEGAEVPLSRIPDDTKFYLNLDSMKWMLTGSRPVDRKISGYLNSLVDSENLNDAYSKFAEIEHASSASVRQIKSMSDAELIRLINLDVKDKYDGNVWVQKLLEVDGLSPAVLRAIMDSKPSTFLMPELTEQSNWSHEMTLEQCEKENWGYGTLTLHFARTSSDTDFLALIAVKTRSSSMLDVVGENASSSIATLELIAKRHSSYQLVRRMRENDDYLASIAHSPDAAKWIVGGYNIGPKTGRVLIASKNEDIRKVVFRRHAYLFSTEWLMRNYGSLTCEALLIVLRTPSTSDEVVLELLNDDRQTVRTAATVALEKRGYSAGWKKVTK